MQRDGPERAALPLRGRPSRDVANPDGKRGAGEPQQERNRQQARVGDLLWHHPDRQRHRRHQDVKMARPPSRSVRMPMGIGARDPRSTGTATSKAVSDCVR